MTLTDDELAARGEGFSVPEGDDPISLGDDAIRNNAVAALKVANRPTRGYLTDEHTMDTVEPGTWEVTNVVVARALGLPSERPGILTVVGVSTAKAARFQSVEDTGVPSREFITQQFAGVWSEWIELARADDEDKPTATAYRSVLRDGLTARKGGRIGTDGRGAVALRFDDSHESFRTIVLPMLAARSLPFTRVTTSETVGTDPIAASEWPALEAACLDHGGEVWNHGRSHLDVPLADVHEEIVGARDTIRSLLPRLPIDCFAPPGGSAMSYGGHMPSTSPEAWNTPAGDLILNAHALVTGYLSDAYYWPLDGTARDGQNHYSLDAYTLTRARELVDRAVNWRTGIVLMVHPDNLDTGDNLSSADLALLLDYVAAERDAGRLLVLTVSGLATADRTTPYRDDLLSVHDGTLSETLLYPQYRRGIAGSTRELVATVSGTPGETITTTIGTQTATHTIPASGTATIRHVVTLPLDLTALSITTDRPVTDAHLWAL